MCRGEQSFENLNGTWNFAFDFGVSGVERKWQECGDEAFPLNITVPFCPESKLSGIEHTDFIPAVWYRKRITLTGEQLTGKVLIHFGAVDYECKLWVNKKLCGEHRGGYSSFTFDITDYLIAGENELTLYSYDDVRSENQPYGKQSKIYQSQMCSYTRTTGIWQTVWLEFVPKHYITRYLVTPHVADSKISVKVFTNGKKETSEIKITAFYDGKEVGHETASVMGGECYENNTVAVVKLSELHLWNVDTPNLYDLTIELISNGEVTDKISGYFGMRSVELGSDGLYINGKITYMRTILDQGFFPDGIYTSPSDEDLKRDILLSKSLGFNGGRMHQRVFEERTLYWADKLGYLCWGEYANNNFMNTGEGLKNFLPEWLETLQRDYNHPCIIGWMPFNESYWSKDLDPLIQPIVYEATKLFDSTRPVVDAAGGFHYKTDMFDVHEYEQDPQKLKEKLDLMLEDEEYFHNPLNNRVLAGHKYYGQPYWISEYGGTFWNPDLKEGDDGWGYGDNPQTEQEFAERYYGLTKVLLDNPRVCGFCYTQLTDIEQEQNGLFNYDRSPKFSKETYEMIKKANALPAAIEQQK